MWMITLHILYFIRLKILPIIGLENISFEILSIDHIIIINSRRDFVNTSFFQIPKNGV